ncbi:unnamed protein product, partial [Meganyctiphanes norvegica]
MNVYKEPPNIMVSISILNTMFRKSAYVIARFRTYENFFYLFFLREYEFKPLEPRQLGGMYMSHIYTFRVEPTVGACKSLLACENTELQFSAPKAGSKFKKVYLKEKTKILENKGDRPSVTIAKSDLTSSLCSVCVILMTNFRPPPSGVLFGWGENIDHCDLLPENVMSGLVLDLVHRSPGQQLDSRYLGAVVDLQGNISANQLNIVLDPLARNWRFSQRIMFFTQGHFKRIVHILLKRHFKRIVHILLKRLKTEIERFIKTVFGGDLLVTMVEYGVGPYVGFPENFNSENVNRVYDDVEASKKGDHECAPMMLLASGFNNEEEAFAFISRVKCSKKERELLLLIIQFRDLAINAKTFKPIQDLVIDLIVGEKRNKELALYYIKQLLMYAAQTSLLEELEDWEIPRFPVTGGQIIERKLPKMKTKFIMRDLLEEWKKSDFTKTSEELLDSIDVEKYKTC